MVFDRRGGGLRRLLDGGTVAAQPARDLLDRFIATRDEGAFEAIIARHGPVVLRVCRSVLNDPTDVEDAFQATFLVLVRKARSLRDGDQLGPWLHGVARRVALQARAGSARRRAREPSGAGSDHATLDRSLHEVEQRELATIIHAELDRLSLPERSAILLCDLEGLSHQEAADQLGWPLGTVKTRLLRGRDRLRLRLVRRGVTLSTSALASSLAGEASAAVVAQTVVLATTRAALAVAAGQALSVGLVSPAVLSLTQGAVRVMFFTKFKAAAIVLAATTSMLAVPTLVAFQGSPRPNPGQPNPPVLGVGGAPATPMNFASGGVAPQGTSPDAIRLQMAMSAVKAIDQRDRDGKPVDVAQRFQWYQRLAQVEVDLAQNRAGRIDAVKSHVARHRQFVAEQARQIASRLAEDRPFNAPGAPSSSYENLWNEVIATSGGLKEAEQWLARVESEPTGLVPAAKPIVPGTEPVMQGGGQSQEPRRQLRIKAVPADAKSNERILAKLDERIAMNFPNETPLADILKYIGQATIDAQVGLPVGIPIYVDPKGLQDRDKTMTSTVAISLEAIPLRTTLFLALDQLDLTYVVEGGLLLIISNESEPTPPGGKAGFQ